MESAKLSTFPVYRYIYRFSRLSRAPPMPGPGPGLRNIELRQLARLIPQNRPSRPPRIDSPSVLNLPGFSIRSSGTYATLTLRVPRPCRCARAAYAHALVRLVSRVYRSTPYRATRAPCAALAARTCSSCVCVCVYVCVCVCVRVVPAILAACSHYR